MELKNLQKLIKRINIITHTKFGPCLCLIFYNILVEWRTGFIFHLTYFLFIIIDILELTFHAWWIRNPEMCSWLIIFRINDILIFLTLIFSKSWISNPIVTWSWTCHIQWEHLRVMFFFVFVSFLIFTEFLWYYLHVNNNRVVSQKVIFITLFLHVCRKNNGSWVHEFRWFSIFSRSWC
jgi:hypothetical protein